MKFTQFQTRLNEALVGSVERQTTHYGHLIQQTQEGVVFVDRERTEFLDLEEAVNHIDQQKIQESIQHALQCEQYEEMSDNTIAGIIKAKHGDIRVTDTLVESYVELASSKLFTLDPVVAEMRSYNKLDRLVENKVDFKLDDNTVIAVDEGTLLTINNTFGNYPDVIAHMRESVDNFMSVVEQLEG